MKIFDFFRRKTAKHADRTVIKFQQKGFQVSTLNIKIKQGELDILKKIFQRNNIASNIE